MRKLTFFTLLFVVFACTNKNETNVQEDVKPRLGPSNLTATDQQEIKRVILEVYSKGFRFQDEKFDVMPWLSPELLHSCVRAKAIEQQSTEFTSVGEKLAIIEQEIFASLKQGYTDVEIIDMKKEGEFCIATVAFGFAFNASSAKKKWQDQLVLTKYKGEWKLDNVLYGEGRNYPRDLKTYLKDYYYENHIFEE